MMCILTSGIYICMFECSSAYSCGTSSVYHEPLNVSPPLITLPRLSCLNPTGRTIGDCANKQPMLQWCSDACLWAISARCPQAESGCQIICGTLFDILGSRKCCLVLLVQTLVCYQMGYMVAWCVRARTSDNQTTTRRNKNTVAHNVDCPARCQRRVCTPASGPGHRNVQGRLLVANTVLCIKCSVLGSGQRTDVC